MNLYASVGFYGLGIDLNVGPEIIIGKFDVAGIPLLWGATVRGLIGFASFFGYASWIDWGVAPMATLHWGVDLGSIWKFDWYVGLGVGISGSTGSYYTYLNNSSIGFGFASSTGFLAFRRQFRTHRRLRLYRVHRRRRRRRPDEAVVLPMNKKTPALSSGFFCLACSLRIRYRRKYMSKLLAAFLIVGVPFLLSLSWFLLLGGEDPQGIEKEKAPRADAGQ